MAYSSVLSRPDSVRPAGLVSVDGRTYPLKSARITAHAEGGIAATTFTQTYGNPYEEPLEVIYTLPLPPNGAAVGYTIRLGKRIIRGEVRRRADAQEDYRKALLEGRTASLLEQNRADTFTQKLGSLPPGETAEVEIEVVQPLTFLPTDGEVPARWEYRFPTVIGVRYEGADGRVPDATELDVDRAADAGTPVRLKASLLVADGSADTILPHAPGNEIDIEVRERGVLVTLRKEMKLDRDLVLRWSAVQQEVGVRIVEGKGLACDNGRYLLITLTPPAAVREGLSRDLTILIDASGSMEGKPLSRAKIVAEALLRSLDPGDRFELLAFASDVCRLVPRPMEASGKNIRQALAALDQLRAGGATEMTRAMVEALKPLRPGSQRQVILLSDGYIGFEGEVIGEVLRLMAPGARLHAVGIGSAPNRALTRAVARAGRGIEILVGDDDDARAASRRLLQATVRPVLADIEVSGPALVALAPAQPQDVLEGQPLVLLAEIGAGGGQLKIQGKQAGTPGAWVSHKEIPMFDAAEGTAGKLVATCLPLGALYGRGAIEDLELLLAAAGGAGERTEIEKRIEELGFRHGIASRKTSLIAISEDPAVDPKDPRRRERLAVEIPAEVSAEGLGLMPSAMLSAPTQASMMFADLASISLDEEASLRQAEPEAPAYKKWSGIFRPRRRSIIKQGARTVEIRNARVLNLDGPVLILEFEAPEDGFLLPDDGTMVDVWFDDRVSHTALVRGSDSSRSGPHQAGLTVRLAIKLADRHVWHHNQAQLHWIGRLDQEEESGPVEYHLHIRLRVVPFDGCIDPRA